MRDLVYPSFGPSYTGLLGRALAQCDVLSVLPEPVSLASHGSLLDIYLLRPHCRLTGSAPLEEEPSSLFQQALQVILIHPEA